MKRKTKNNKNRIDLSIAKAHLDGYGEGVLALSKSLLDKEKPFMVSFSNENGDTLLRRFPNILRAVRSYRRYILLSDEIENGFL